VARAPPRHDTTIPRTGAAGQAKPAQPLVENGGAGLC